MSTAWLIAPERSDAVPRCARDGVASFMGTRRPPALPDEEGAESVVDLLFGGRAILYPLDPTHFRVRLVHGR